MARKIFWLVFNPGSILLVLSLWAVYAAWWGGRKPKNRGWVRVAVTLMMGIILGLNVLPLRNWVVRPLEDLIPPPAALPAQVTGVIILGGGIDGYLSSVRHEVIVTGAAARIIAAVRLAAKYPKAKIVYSGGNAALNGAGVSESVLAAQLWQEMGLNPGQFIGESASRNTYENARFSRDLVHPKSDETWLLVTSALHMPRALELFRSSGWSVIPYPVGYTTAPSRLDGEWNGMLGGQFLDNLEALYWGSREWFGLVGERLQGRTDQFLPTP